MDMRSVLLTLCFMFVDLYLHVQGHPHEEDVAHAIDHESHLYYHLLDHYVRDIRPAANSSDPVRVAIKISILNINGPENWTNKVKLTFLMKKSWHDPRLKWNVSDYAGLNTFSILSNQIWQPELSPMESDILNSEEGPQELATLSSRGDIEVLLTGKAHLHCTPIDVEKFPSDGLECGVTLMSNSYNAKQLKLVLDSYESMEEAFDLQAAATTTTNLAAWSLNHKSARFEVHVRGSRVSGTGHPGVRITLPFRRARGFYWNLFVIPAAMLAYLIPLNFVFPPASSGRAIFGVLVALGEIFLLAGMNPYWPHSVTATPYIGLFCVSATVLACLGAILSLLLTSLVTSGTRNKEVPAWLKSLCFGRCGIRRLVCLEDYSPVGAHRADTRLGRNGATLIESESLPATDQGARPPHDAFQPEFVKDIQLLVAKLCADTSRKRTIEEWEEVVRVLDRMFCVIFFLLVLTTSFAFLS